MMSVDGKVVCVCARRLTDIRSWDCDPSYAACNVFENLVRIHPDSHSRTVAEMYYNESVVVTLI